MGLDMHLQRKRYIPLDEREHLTIDGLAHPVDGEKVEYLIEETGCWRKAIAIHRWFVDHVQGGTDDCGAYPVSREQLQELFDTVNAVLASCELVAGKVWNDVKFENGQEADIWEDGQVVADPTLARALLPTTEGFFFGSTQYDEYYVEDLQETKRILEDALTADDASEFSYQSSW